MLKDPPRTERETCWEHRFDTSLRKMHESTSKNPGKSTQQVDTQVYNRDSRESLASQVSTRSTEQVNKTLDLYLERSLRSLLKNEIQEKEKEKEPQGFRVLALATRHPLWW